MPKIGGWIIEFKIDGDSITQFSQRWITFFKEIKNDYPNHN
jgi:hypothetical protein